jgi:hypothetical protein
MGGDGLNRVKQTRVVEVTTVTRSGYVKVSSITLAYLMQDEGYKVAASG